MKKCVYMIATWLFIIGCTSNRSMQSIDHTTFESVFDVLPFTYSEQADHRSMFYSKNTRNIYDIDSLFPPNDIPNFNINTFSYIDATTLYLSSELSGHGYVLSLTEQHHVKLTHNDAWTHVIGQDLRQKQIIVENIDTNQIEICTYQWDCHTASIQLPINNTNLFTENYAVSAQLTSGISPSITTTHRVTGQSSSHDLSPYLSNALIQADEQLLHELRPVSFTSEWVLLNVTGIMNVTDSSSRAYDKKFYLHLATQQLVALEDTQTSYRILSPTAQNGLLVTKDTQIGLLSYDFDKQQEQFELLVDTKNLFTDTIEQQINTVYYYHPEKQKIVWTSPRTIFEYSLVDQKVSELLKYVR